jgi:hypoxanthine-DNA glycosylase
MAQVVDSACSLSQIAETMGSAPLVERINSAGDKMSAMTGKPVGRCFAPVVDNRTRVLILGSLPGARSLSAGQYYAHPQNQFWRLAGGVIGACLSESPYHARLEILSQHGIGLWDTVAEARRAGSLDSALEAIAPNDLLTLIEQLPSPLLIAFNGKKAAMIGRRQLMSVPYVATVTLPSSSPAHTMAFERKLEFWTSALGPTLKSRYAFAHGC